MTDAEKAERYRTALEKYLRFKDKRELESKQPINASVETQANDTDNSTSINKQSKSDVIELSPKSLRTKAKMLLKRIGKNPDILDWNENGELKYKGKIIQDSNISYLLADLLKQRPTHTSTGYEDIAKGLGKKLMYLGIC